MSRSKRTSDISLQRIKDPLRPANAVGPNNLKRTTGNGAVPPQLRNTKAKQPDNTINTMQRRFIDNFVRTGIKGQSALDAGYSTPASATRLLASRKIQAAIESRRKRMEQKLDEIFDVDAKAVLKEIALIAFSSMGTYFKDWGQKQQVINIPDKKSATGFREVTINENFVIPKNKSELTELQQRCISEISLEETGRGKTFKFKKEDKLGALKLLCSYFGLTDGSGNKVDPNDTVKQLRQAAAAATNTMPGGDRYQEPTEEPSDASTEED